MGEDFRKDQHLRNKSKLNFGKMRDHVPVKHLVGDVTEQLLTLVLESEERAGRAKSGSQQHVGVFKAMEVMRPPRIRIEIEKRRGSKNDS